MANDIKDFENDKTLFELIESLYKEGIAPLRYRYQCCFRDVDSFKRVLENKQYHLNYKEDPWLTLGPLKLYKDGSLGVSARSDGSVNVQIIMEELGGGGHQTVAGVQLDNMRAADVEPQIIALAKKQLEQLEEKDNNESDSVTRC